ncbi:MAG: WecB/TagA/CpsF family glycosyltransferase [Cyanobacteria bacterium J06598_1]
MSSLFIIEDFLKMMIAKYGRKIVKDKRPRTEVTGAFVTALPLAEQVEWMVHWAKANLSKVVCVANVHMLMEARNNPILRSALEKAHLVTPDGMPLVWVMRSLGFSSQDRVAGMDIFENACRRCEEEGISIYLIGSTTPVLEKMVSRLSDDFPQLTIAGTKSPPFRKLSPTEEEEIIQDINNSGAGLTFVALGCPKQEYWMLRHHNKIRSVMVGIGGAFPVYAGLHKHAPRWIRENGLEWLYRWVQEPRRLSNRYLSTIPPFMYLAVKQVAQAKLRKSIR